MGGPSAWGAASAYNADLDDIYGEDVYIMKTVAQLGASVSEGDYVATHYGDWPAPEVFVVNIQ